MEECPLTPETQANDTAKELIDKVMRERELGTFLKAAKNRFPSFPENHGERRQGRTGLKSWFCARGGGNMSARSSSATA